MFFMREHPILIHFQTVWVEIITGFALRYCVLVLCWGIWFNVKQEGITHTFLVVFVLLAWTIVWNNILWQNRFIMLKSTNLCLMRIFHKICWNKSDVPNMMIHDQWGRDHFKVLWYMISLKRDGNKKITVLTICYDFLGHENQISVVEKAFMAGSIKSLCGHDVTLWTKGLKRVWAWKAFVGRKRWTPM